LTPVLYANDNTATGDGNSIEVTTSVTVNTGDPPADDVKPIVKCKWESTSDDPVSDDDPAAGCQVAPPLQYQGTKKVYYWAVVTDPQGIGDIASVYADVYHPEGYPEYGTFKYEVTLQLYTGDDALDRLSEAYNESLITFGTGYDYSDVYDEILEGDATLWWGWADIDYCQPAGYYKVEVFADDAYGYRSDKLENYFEYLLIVGIEIDFTEINFGTVSVCTPKWITGDWTWGDAPTIRNIGNWDCKIGVTFTDMNFGTRIENGVEKPNVRFNARLGHNDSWADAKNNGIWAEPGEEMYPLPGNWPEVIIMGVHGILMYCQNVTQLKSALEYT
jgi:hypothetical protein